MTDVYAECPVHGFSVVSNFIDLKNSSASLIGNTTDCPACNRVVPIVDGRYVTDGQGKVAVTPNSPLSAAQLRRLKTALDEAKRARKQGTSSDQQIAQDLERSIREVIPQGSEILDMIGTARSQGIAVWLTVLLTIIMPLLINQQPGTDADVERIVDETFQRVEQNRVDREEPSPAESETAPAQEDPAQEK